MNKVKIFSITIFISLILLATTSFAKEGTVNASNGLILRKEASKTAEIIMTISDKSSVEIIEQSGEWYKVKYNGNEGYLFAEYVEVQEEAKPSEDNQTPVENKTDDNKQESTQNETPTYPQSQVIKSAVNVYSIPSITSKIIGNAPQDSTITINYELNNWVNITYGDINGWIRKYYINNTAPVNNNPETKQEEKKEEEPEQKTDNNVVENRKGYINVSTSANIRESASTSANIVTTLLTNTEVTITGEEGEFYKIQYQDYTGYVSKSLVSDKKVSTTSRSSSGERQVDEPKSPVVDENKTQANNTNANTNTSQANTSAGQNVIAFAKKYLGYSYVSGGTKPGTGFDCSGFTYYVYNSCGYSLSRLCSVQAKSGTAVSRANLAAGDLIFFNNGSNGSIGHVGIYIGGGSFIHAANTRRGVTTDSINSGYYNTYYYSARRIIN